MAARAVSAAQIASRSWQASILAAIGAAGVQDFHPPLRLRSGSISPPFALRAYHNPANRAGLSAV